MHWLWFLLAFVAGVAVPVQVGVNSTLRNYFPHSMQAAFMSFAVGMVASLAYCLAIRSPWPGVASLGRAPWWAWTGGVLGAFFVWSSIVVGPKIGAAATLGLFVAGQMIAALVLDHHGALGLPIFPVNSGRIVGVLLIIVGVALTVATRGEPVRAADTSLPQSGTQDVVPGVG